VTLEIRDDAGQVVRRYSSTDPVSQVDPIAGYSGLLGARSASISARPGVHRFLWDLHYQPVPGVKPAYPISAIYRNTAPEDTSPWVLPGRYTVVLTANGTSYTQALNVRMDPRVKTASAELVQQFKLSNELYHQWLSLAAATEKISAIRTQLSELRAKAKADELRTQIDAVSAPPASVCNFLNCIDLRSQLIRFCFARNSES